jgi:hypothetical protein
MIELIEQQPPQHVAALRSHFFEALSTDQLKSNDSIA